MSGSALAAGDVVEVTIGNPAHGGHCVARHEGRVLFVRHVLPGERARVRVSDVRDRFARADAVEILEPSPHRVTPPCPWAGPGRCGGCDWQHADLPTQRAIKAGIVVEQLVRLGRLDPGHRLGDGTLAGLTVAQVPGARPDGTGWRTRVQFSVSPAGRLGLRAHRSAEVVEVDRCLLAADGVDGLDLPSRDWAGWERVEAISSSTGDRAVVLSAPQPPQPPKRPERPGRGPRRGRPPQQAAAAPRPAPPLPELPAGVTVAGPSARRGRGHVVEELPGPGGPIRAKVTGSGFWQVHPGAARALLEAVLDQVRPQEAEHLLDLYCGVGLFSLGLGPAVGPGGRVTAIESDPQAVRDARRNLHALPQVRIVPGRVDQQLRELAQADAVVLDPPRAGAGPKVLDQVARLTPRVVSYVACDPASLGRDTALLHERGYRLTGLRAFDLFPHTHHVECVAGFVPACDG